MVDAILGSDAHIQALDGDVDLELRPGMQSAEVLTIAAAASRSCAASGAATSRSGCRWSRRRSSTTRSASSSSSSRAAQGARAAPRALPAGPVPEAPRPLPQRLTVAHFYLRRRPRAADLAVGASVALDGAEARHAVTVSRVRVGGDAARRRRAGHRRVAAVVATVGPRRLEVRVEVRRGARAIRAALILVQALAKGDRDELAVQAATELGVDAVIPGRPRAASRAGRAQRSRRAASGGAAIVREAVKQSMRPRVPEVGARDDEGAARGRRRDGARARARPDRRGAAVAARPGDGRGDAATDVVARRRTRGRHRPPSSSALRRGGRDRWGSARSSARPPPDPPRWRSLNAALGRW